MTEHTANGLVETDAGLEHATVKASTEAGVIVHGVNGVATAWTSLGCLIEPQAGDRVLVSRQRGERFVIAVLAREQQQCTIRVPGDLAIESDRLTLRGRTRLDASGHSQLGLWSPKVSVTGSRTELTSDTVSLTGDEAQVTTRRARLSTSALDVCADRIVQAARQVMRRVEDVEVLHMGSLIQRIRETLISRSKRTSVTARHDVHIDGERIHMG